MCPKCYVGLHWEHAKPGAPPCPKCGHEHPEGLSFEDYKRAGAEWNEPKCSRCGLAVDERAKYFADPLCAACSRLAGRIVDLNPTGVYGNPPDPEWQVVASRRNRGALDDWTEYLCIRVRWAPEEKWEMAVCGYAPPVDECGLATSHALQPIADSRLINITEGDGSEIAEGLEDLEWPDSDFELVVQAIAAM